jgi:protein-S-isoprenylcysteine O-methyltransferase
MLYLTFVLTIPQWMVSLRKGEGVSLLPERGGQERPMWVQIAMMILGIAISIPLFYYLWTPIIIFSQTSSQILGVVGLIIYIAGFGFLMWARRTLGRHWGISTSLQAKLHSNHELIQSGPYTIVRHPMYFGAWVMMFGLLLSYPKWVILILYISMVASLSMRARREEAVLAERFGEKWLEYKEQTSFLIPYLY